MIKRSFKTFLAMFLALILGAQSAPAQPVEAPDRGEHFKFWMDYDGFSSWMEYYYFAKDSSGVPGFLDWLNSLGKSEFGGGFEAMATSFLAGIFIENPTLVEGWLAEQNFTGEIHDIVREALNLSGNARLSEKLFGVQPNESEDISISLLEIGSDNPRFVSLMWEAFQATGNEIYVMRLIDSLSVRGFPQSFMASIASSSLSKYAREHELVRRIVLREHKLRMGEERAILEGLIDPVSAKRAGDGQITDLSGFLWIVSQSAIAEINQTTEVESFPELIAEAKRGESLAIVLPVAGMDLTEDYRADVAYDLKIIDPSGAIYAGHSYANLIAIDSRTPCRFLYFTNQDTINIRFEPKDKLGKYTFVATIHDKVGGKSITLKEEIELTE